MITPCNIHPPTGCIGLSDCTGCQRYRSEAEQHRLECEARAWLELGYTTAERIAALREKLSKKPAPRSAESIEKLVQEMRRQWKNMPSNT